MQMARAKPQIIIMHPHLLILSELIEASLMWKPCMQIEVRELWLALQMLRKENATPPSIPLPTQQGSNQ